MATIVNMHDAKTNLSKLVGALEDGSETEIIIARNGKPAGKLVPITAKQRRPIGLYDGVYPDISLEKFNAADNEIAEAMVSGPLFPDEGARQKKPRRKP